MKRQWWHDKTAYQIYPKSFCDSNADGIGDLKGVISKLDDLQALGIEILWLSPVYLSPMADQGYDIADYYSIDPRFGTMEDMERLLAEARKRGIAVLMDLVVNHCSDEHEWFRRACEEPDGPYGQYFYIRDWHEGEKLPTNWCSYFGGPCWDKLPGHEDKVYLHLFHKKQPDLNWENPALRQEIYKMINWWLDKGLAGFRIDAIINIKKALPLCDYPPDRPDGLCYVSTMLRHAHGVLDFLDEMARNTFQKHDAFTIAELFDDRPGDLPRFIGEGGCFSTIFDFSENALDSSPNGWYDRKPITAEQYKQAVFAAQARAADVGFMANIIENHDEPRGVSRYLPRGERSEAAKKMLGGLNFMLRGLPFLYQGQELGMENVPFADISQIDDISTLDEYQGALRAGLSPEDAFAAIIPFSRDNARTPYQWDASANAGFTTGKPWLMVNPNYPRINLAEQRGRADSVYHFYRELIALRRSPAYRETVVWGSLTPYLAHQRNLMAYWRKGEKTLLVAGNFQAEPQVMPLPHAPKQILLNNLPDIDLRADGSHLAGYQFLVMEM